MTPRPANPNDALALVDKPAVPAVVVTKEHIELIKRTVAQGATDAELELFIYDCKRRGVHPLDRLIHFTKRNGKYTPVTSIDMFRSRAAGTKEHMGTDDAVFRGTPKGQDFEASVTVYRLVQGEKCPFTATARWTEYLPGEGNDFMWRKMPYGQLGKCAEALALRKGFPQELQGLYTDDEMGQAFNDAASGESSATASVIDVSASEKKPDPPVETPPAPKAAAAPPPAPATPSNQHTTPALRVKSVKERDGTYWITLEGDVMEGKYPRSYSTRNKKLADEVERFEGTDHRVRLVYQDNPSITGDRIYHNVRGFSVDDGSPSMFAGK